MMTTNQYGYGIDDDKGDGSEDEEAVGEDELGAEDGEEEVEEIERGRKAAALRTFVSYSRHEQ